VFDSNTNGPPFKFKVGGGQVIKAWDLGVDGGFWNLFFSVSFLFFLMNGIHIPGGSPG
jgi:hypothetical protein